MKYLNRTRRAIKRRAPLPAPLTIEQQATLRGFLDAALQPLPELSPGDRIIGPVAAALNYYSRVWESRWSANPHDSLPSPAGLALPIRYADGPGWMLGQGPPEQIVAALRRLTNDDETTVETPRYSPSDLARTHQRAVKKLEREAWDIR